MASLGDEVFFPGGRLQAKWACRHAGYPDHPDHPDHPDPMGFHALSIPQRLDGSRNIF